MGQELIDNLEVVVGHLRNAETAPDIYTNVLGALWQANVVVEQQGAAWINNELEYAYGKFAELEHPDELPSDGHREQWRRARNHIVQEAEDFANKARTAADNGSAMDSSSLEPLARATEVMAYQLAEGIEIH
jgi:hypothetical protein